MRHIAVSKRDTPFTAEEAMRLLGLDGVEYHLAVVNGLLAQNVGLFDDPSDRLRFHSFWDLLGYILYARHVSSGHPVASAKQLADERCASIADVVDNVVALHPSRDLITYDDPRGVGGGDVVLNDEELEVLDLHDRLVRVSLSTVQQHHSALFNVASNQLGRS